MLGGPKLGEHMRLPEPKAAAREDWGRRSPRAMIIGLLGAGGPRLDRETGFYYRSLGCVLTEDNERFVREYNKEIAALVSEYGYPAWGPVARAPSRVAAIKLIQLGDHYPAGLQGVGAVPADHSLRRDVIAEAMDSSELSRWRPNRVFSDHSMQIELVGGPIGERAAAIVLLDLRESRWMSTYQYRRKHHEDVSWERLWAGRSIE